MCWPASRRAWASAGSSSIRARTNSLLLSADNGALPPTPTIRRSATRYTPSPWGGGVVLKYNARQTNHQRLYRGRPSGPSAPGPACRCRPLQTGRICPAAAPWANLLGRQILIPMVDIGLAQLAMHSAVETASCQDAAYMAAACEAFE